MEMMLVRLLLWGKDSFTWNCNLGRLRLAWIYVKVCRIWVEVYWIVGGNMEELGVGVSEL